MLNAIETVWKVRGVRGRITECSIHQEPDGKYSMRVSTPGADVLYTCRLANLARARRKAEEWRQTLLALGEFHDCTSEGLG